MFPWVSAGLFFLVFYCLSRTYFIVTFEAEINEIIGNLIQPNGNSFTVRVKLKHRRG